MRYFSIKMKIQLLFLVIILSSPLLSQPIDLSLEWTTTNGVPFATELENTIEDEVAGLPNILGLIVIHHGKVVSEHYYNDSYADDVYNVWSVTKSYASTLVGQAYDMGMINGPDSSLVDFFPDYGIDYVSELTLDHLLSMSTGYYDIYGWPAWYNQSTSSLLSMPYVEGPGDFFYNNSACHLNSHVIYYGTGQTPHEFASTYLFPYLGIDDPQWNSGYLNINDGSASLQLTLREMVKLGQLYLQGGYSGDEQILSSDWIERATTYKVPTGWDQIPSYGYLWWLPNEDSYLAFGYGGQYILVVPDLNLVIGTHSTDWGPGDINTHQNVLRDALVDQLAPIFDRPSVAINEILASNNGCCYDEYGENDNYIELYNFGNDTVDVAGLFLTNDIDDHETYSQIQTGSDSTLIAPGDFLLIWSDNSPTQGVLHLDDLLSNTGGEMGLYAPDTTTIVDFMSYSVQAPDMAYAREQDAGEDWVYMDPTPGLSNTTIMNTEEKSVQPRSFRLAQNFPNPFNPITNINYETLEDASVTIHVFDVSGRMIETLISTYHQAGNYSVQWDAKDYDGKPVSAGVYIYTIESNNNLDSKKMILLK